MRTGAWITEAAEVSGWRPGAVDGWILRGRQSLARCAEDDTASPDEPWHSFAEEVERAIAEHEVLLLGLIRRAATGDTDKGIRSDWKAAAWMLEKKNPRRYGQRVNVAGDPEAPIPIQVAVPGLSEAERERRAAEVLAALSGLGADKVFDELPVETLISPP